MANTVHALIHNLECDHSHGNHILVRASVIATTYERLETNMTAGQLISTILKLVDPETMLDFKDLNEPVLFNPEERRSKCFSFSVDDVDLVNGKIILS